MIRTQIQLPDDEYRDLRELAHRQHRAMADCVREAVAEYLVKAQAPSEGLKLAGKYRPTPPTEDLKDHDLQWADAILSKRNT